MNGNDPQPIKLCPFYLNPDSIKHIFLYCQESKEFFSKTLWWFNEYHKESIQLTNKQMLFNTFDDSLPGKCQFQPNANFVYWFYCKRTTCILARTM